MKLIKRNTLVILISLVLQGAWEYFICGYFYEVDVIPKMGRLMLEATFGDVLFTVFVFNIMVLLYQSVAWRLNLRNVLGIILLAIAGAMYFESRALFLGRWVYSSQMIYLKDTNIGMVPLLQFALLIPLTIKLEEFISIKAGILKHTAK